MCGGIGFHNPESADGALRLAAKLRRRALRPGLSLMPEGLGYGGKLGQMADLIALLHLPQFPFK
jgi:hypothetical protein